MATVPYRVTKGRKNPACEQTCSYPHSGGHCLARDDRMERRGYCVNLAATAGCRRLHGHWCIYSWVAWDCLSELWYFWRPGNIPTRYWPVVNLMPKDSGLSLLKRSEHSIDTRTTDSLQMI